MTKSVDFELNVKDDFIDLLTSKLTHSSRLRSNRQNFQQLKRETKPSSNSKFTSIWNF